MRRHTNFLVYGILLIILSIMIFCFTGLCYPLLSFPELFKQHPVGSWGLPGILIILGLVLIEIERDKKKYDE